MKKKKQKIYIRKRIEQETDAINVRLRNTQDIEDQIKVIDEEGVVRISSNSFFNIHPFMMNLEKNYEDGRACYWLGAMYEYSSKVKTDYELATRYYEEACDLNNPDACNRLSDIYLDGEIFEPDDNKSQEYYEKACANGYLKSTEIEINEMIKGNKTEKEEVMKDKKKGNIMPTQDLNLNSKFIQLSRDLNDNSNKIDKLERIIERIQELEDDHMDEILSIRNTTNVLTKSVNLSISSINDTMIEVNETIKKLASEINEISDNVIGLEGKVKGIEGII